MAYRTGCRKVSNCQQQSFQDYTHDHMDYHIPYTYMKQFGFKTFQIICHVLVFMITRDRFTDTAAILNLLDLRSIMGCPGGHEHDPINSLSISARFSGQFFFTFS